MFDVTELIQTGGLLLIAAIVFSESGLMVGAFLPGDTLLLSAGILAAGGQFNIVAAVVIITAAALAGDNLGYQLGKSLGPKLFHKRDGIIFRKEYIEKSEAFYEKYGARTMLVAHFVPIVRSFAPVTAGASNMDRKKFIMFDTIGVIAWATGLTLLGYFVGSRIPHIQEYIEPAILAVIALFLVPTLWHILKDPKIRQAIKAKFKKRNQSKSDIEA